MGKVAGQLQQFDRKICKVIGYNQCLIRDDGGTVARDHSTAHQSRCKEHTYNPHEDDDSVRSDVNPFHRHNPRHDLLRQNIGRSRGLISTLKLRSCSIMAACTVMTSWNGEKQSSGSSNIRSFLMNKRLSWWSYGLQLRK